MLPILPRDDVSLVAAIVVDIEDAASIANIDEGVYTYIALNANKPRKLLLLQRGFKPHSSFQEIDDDAYTAEYDRYENMSFTERWARDVGRGQVCLAGHVYFKLGHGIYKWDVRSGHYIPSKSDGTDFGLPPQAYVENIEKEKKSKRMRIASLHATIL